MRHYRIVHAVNHGLRSAGEIGTDEFDSARDVPRADDHVGRRQHVEELIKPALTKGHVVILDRYYFSMMAYQGARGFDPAQIRKENETFAPVPDLLLILDLDVDTALKRIGSRGDTANEFEQHSNLSRCREIFLSLNSDGVIHL